MAHDICLTEELAEANKRPGTLTDAPARIEFEAGRDPADESNPNLLVAV
jgi:hypothetical protein